MCSCFSLAILLFLEIIFYTFDVYFSFNDNIKLCYTISIDFFRILLIIIFQSKCMLIISIFGRIVLNLYVKLYLIPYINEFNYVFDGRLFSDILYDRLFYNYEI